MTCARRLFLRLLTLSEAEGSPACPERSAPFASRMLLRGGRVTRHLPVLLLLCALSPVTSPLCFAQTESASLSGTIVDRSGAVVPDAQVRVTNEDTNVTVETKTNGAGVYNVPSLKPGRYRILVTKQGFKQIDLRDVTLNVQDSVNRNFTLDIGGTSETVIVNAGDALNVNTTDASVSTVVDRQFAENLPMNGRSFQTLIQLTPGVVLTTSNANDAGQFSVNGQRAAANYWTVDGVSANIGASSTIVQGNGLGGALPTFSVLGGTNSLVSVDATQEFRIQTSTFAPEFGRTPGGQISIATRSGTNQFHGTLFDYFRNDVLDANDWFANSAGLPKPKERQNDFGGTFSGPILKDRTFFFFSYEGLRLRLPQTALTTVPDLSARQNAVQAMQPFLNAYPLPNGADNPATGVANFNATFSNSSTLDAYSLRLDHKLREKLNIFGRYNYSPSELDQRGFAGAALSIVFPARITTQTGTAGLTWSISPMLVNDFRFNYSRTEGSGQGLMDNFGGAVPLSSLPFPNSFDSQNSEFSVVVFSLTSGGLIAGKVQRTVERQINVVDNLSLQKGPHSVKVGIDYRRLTPILDPHLYQQAVAFSNVSSFGSGTLTFRNTSSSVGGTLLFQNVGVFGQDTWRIVQRLSVTYGLRWDLDIAPSALSGPSLPAVTGFDLNNLSGLALAPAGTAPFKTTYGNFAPRIGVAYQLPHRYQWATVIRGGFGVFYDLATSEVGNMISTLSYPFGASKKAFGAGAGTFPLSPATAAPPPITPAGLAGPGGILFAFDPNLKLPYTLQWNVALEQELGKQQTLSATYVGAAGKRLLESETVFGPNPSFSTADLVSNAAVSNYNALQLQFRRRLSHGLQAVASYAWSHSIDTASAGSNFLFNAAVVPGINPNANHASSDFDIRNAFSTGITYDIPFGKRNGFANAILRGWSVQNIFQARSAPPVNVYNFLSGFASLFGAVTLVRPDLVPGIPLYLFGPQFPGGKAINSTPGAVAGGCPDGSQSVGPFCPPPSDPNTGAPLRQGNLGRNALRGFGATQWDFAVHREFPVHEAVKLQFRAELFNVLNHPNFGPPSGDISGILQPNFGQATQMLGQSLNGGGIFSNLGGGAFNPLYQIGGPRSIQFALKLAF